jgi:hypothetical protein
VAVWAVLWLLGTVARVLGADATINAPAVVNNAIGSGPSAPDPVLSLLMEKGMITEEEANKVQAQVDARRTNEAAQYALENSKWKLNSGVKSLELFGDLRLRYEDRSEEDPSGGKIDLNRLRYAVRIGLRGDLAGDFYFGVRLETSSNPRSTWVTAGGSSPDPYGKSASGIAIGQAYLGWAPASWLDLTVGKMPNPLYTTSMVWSPSINPEGAAEHLKYTVGDLDAFINLAQFLYQDENPNSASKGLYGSGINASSLLGQTDANIVQVAWQGGVNYRITSDLSAKAAAGVYQYYGLSRSTTSQGDSPYYGDNYVGEGAYAGTNSPYPYNGYSGTGTSGNIPGFLSSGYPNNQTGLDYLTVLEFPFEINYKFKKVDARIFGDFAYNIQGAERAREAAIGYADYLSYESSLGLGSVSVKPFPAQIHDVKAYQIGLALASKDALGLVNGTTSKKGAWELRTYWQHVEQYALDPNLLDLDYFAGAENLEGVYAAISYSFSDNVIGTFRYGYASRINHLIGTGGSGTDIPQMNPINYYQLVQVDLTYRF